VTFVFKNRNFFTYFGAFFLPADHAPPAAHVSAFERSALFWRQNQLLGDQCVEAIEIERALGRRELARSHDSVSERKMCEE
jgi:hypothetical protein